MTDPTIPLLEAVSASSVSISIASLEEESPRGTLEELVLSAESLSFARTSKSPARSEQNKSFAK
jgi:hypothetical protein